jgi:steroid 5-alpha reductase family enzyme
MAEPKNRQALVTIIAATLIGAAIAWMGSDAGLTVGTVPVFALCAALAFGINWVVYVPSSLNRTEHFYDLTGGITYISVIVTAVVLVGELDLRSSLVAGMVLVWSLRLATFLFRRISRDGGNSRFDHIKTRPVVFLMAWTLQGLWVVLTAAAALAVITGGVREPLGALGVVGLVVWGAGFAFEIVADRQKSRFKADPANKGRFINTGLWSWSRHPNYFGEIVLWTGMALVAAPVLQGWQWATLVSPVFVTVLLTMISGIPPLERQADERWGGQPDYEAYKRNTPVLVPWPPAR